MFCAGAVAVGVGVTVIGVAVTFGVSVAVGVSVAAGVSVAVIVGVAVTFGVVGISAKSWVVTLPEVTVTPVVVLIWNPVALAVTLYVPAAMLML